MGASEGFIALLKDLLSGIPPVSVRRMFGGAGLFSDGVMFAIVIDDVLYLKADASTCTAFESEGMTPFSYERHGRRVTLSYWRAPEGLFDDSDELQSWALQALSVAKQHSVRTTRRKRRKS